MTNNSKTSYGILIALSMSHLFNDMLQSLITSDYPLLKEDMGLTFAEIGLVTLFYQIAASVFQPVMGLLLDKKPNPYFLPIGMGFTFVGLTLLAYAGHLPIVFLSVVLVGIGSSILHPEASRLTSMASGGKRGLAQSVFQVGGNTGSAIGPLLAAMFIAPYGRENTALLALIAFVGMAVMSPVCRWYRRVLKEHRKRGAQPIVVQEMPLSKKKTIFAIGILLVLIFSKYMYMASLTSYYTFYLIEKFGVSIETSQILLFVFLAATAIGTCIGGPVGDRIGRKYVIWASILGTAPFALLMPYAPLVGTVVLSFMVGLILSSAFPAIVIYAQILLPNHIGLVSGLFFGFAFGIAGVSSALLGHFADIYDIFTVYNICAYIPLLGLITYFLPDIEKK
ncbi:MAG: MFS transporter [Bacteroidales bacterium]|nr:MFS transporter [Bacteroidales bacterium]